MRPWWGFTTADDRQRLEAVICRWIWFRLCHRDQTTMVEMIKQSDDVLFTQALNNNHHVLHKLLPNKLEITYQLRSHALLRQSGSTTQCDYSKRATEYERTFAYCIYIYISIYIYIYNYIIVMHERQFNTSRYCTPAERGH